MLIKLLLELSDAVVELLFVFMLFLPIPKETSWIPPDSVWRTK